MILKDPKAGPKGLQFILYFLRFLLICQGSVIPIPNPEETGPFFQGDILMTSFLSGRVDTKYRWPNGTVFYEFEPSYPNEMRETFHKATLHIKERTCLTFLERENGEEDFIFVVSSISSACFSYVGRQGGKQLISLPLSCHRLGTFIHELLHSIGFHHEHSRTDRDDFVSILWENVSPGKESQFIKYDEAKVTSFGVPYDYQSIMHYSRNAFSKSASFDTIMPLGGNVRIGQRTRMSERDVAKVNRMYKCEQ